MTTEEEAAASVTGAHDYYPTDEDRSVWNIWVCDTDEETIVANARKRFGHVEVVERLVNIRVQVRDPK